MKLANVGYIAFNQDHSRYFSQTMWKSKNKFQKAEIVLKASYNSRLPTILRPSSFNIRQTYILCQNPTTDFSAC